MCREADLRQIYQTAIALTEQQTKAIQTDDWDKLIDLLDQRERCIAQAESLLGHPAPLANQAEIADQLRTLQRCDQENQRLLQAKQTAVQAELHSLDRSKTALTGYMESFQEVLTPSFVNLDQ